MSSQGAGWQGWVVGQYTHGVLLPLRTGSTWLTGQSPDFTAEKQLRFSSHCRA